MSASSNCRWPSGSARSIRTAPETELIVNAAELTVYILDGRKIHSAKGSNLKAVVQEGGKVTPVELKNTDGKKLIGKLAAPLPKSAIVVLTGKDGEGHAVSALYVIN